MEAQAAPRLFRVAPDDVFEDVLAKIDRGKMIAAAPNVAALLTMAAAVGGDDDDPTALQQLLGPVLGGLVGAEPDFSFLRPQEPRWLPLVSATGSGRIHFIFVQFGDVGGQIDRLSQNLAWLRSEIASFVASHPERAVPYGRSPAGLRTAFGPAPAAGLAAIAIRVR